MSLQDSLSDSSLRDSQCDSNQSKPYNSPFLANVDSHKYSPSLANVDSHKPSPSLAEGARGWVESLPFHFHKNSPKDSQTLAFSPKIERFAEPKAFALKAKDDALRLNSRSGGAFSLIAEYVLNRGGVVFGASFDENLNVVHRFIESPTELDILRRSKYVESFIGDTYKQARDFLKAGRIVLFSGVQCQIHALNAFLRKPYANLLTIEVICNSVPSAKIWDIYKESLLESDDEKLIDFNFRGKNLGWENYSIIATTNKEQKIIPNAHSPYLYNAWATHIITRKSCGNCYSKGFVSGADFTIGDFWGIREYHADFVDDKGVSCVLAHNQKALEILDSLQDLAHIIATTAPIITLGNPAALRSNGTHANRDSILREVINAYSHTKDAKKAMAILAQYAQNPNPKITPLRHYYLVWKNDPLRKTISNALKRARKWLLNQKKLKD
ncbi:Coenzyme F420 hydrogenase/dehydrogenase, beta subunit C-terminal domain [Helicobacter sp. 23-1045]